MIAYLNTFQSHNDFDKFCWRRLDAPHAYNTKSRSLISYECESQIRYNAHVSLPLPSISHSDLILLAVQASTRQSSLRPDNSHVFVLWEYHLRFCVNARVSALSIDSYVLFALINSLELYYHGCLSPQPVSVVTSPTDFQKWWVLHHVLWIGLSGFSWVQRKEST